MLDIFVQIFALARLLHLLIEENGPYGMLEKFRRWAGVDELGSYTTELGGLLSCHLCFGIWLAPVVVFLYNFHTVTYWFVWCLAVAQGAAVAYELMERIMYATPDQR